MNRSIWGLYDFLLTVRKIESMAAISIMAIPTQWHYNSRWKGRQDALIRNFLARC